MSETIIDGTGKGYEAKIDENNLLHTFSITEDRQTNISYLTARSFLIATNFISLTTTGSFNALLYIKNTSDLNLYINTLRVCSTHSGSIQTQIKKDVTAGTIVSDANNAIYFSSNLSSNLQFSDYGVSYAASGDGKTFTDGTFMTQFINGSPGHTIQNYKGLLLLPKGSSIGIETKPSASTTICIEIAAWLE